MSRPGSLGARLRRMRRDVPGLTQVQMAADLGWPPSKISKMESDIQMPTAEDVRRFTARCGQPDAADELLDLLENAQTVRDSARRPAGRSQAGRQVSMDERTRAATRIRDVEPMAIPGLLQTADYALSIASQVARIYGAGDVSAAVEARMERQRVLYDRDGNGEPRRTFEFVVTEAALRMPPCPVQVMIGQLDRLLAILGLDNVTLAVIPMGTPLSFAPYFGFLMLDDVVIVEDYLGSNETSGEGAAVFSRIFDLLMDNAVSEKGAVRALIMAAQDSLREG